MNKHKLKLLLLDILFLIFLVFVDQFTKYIAVLKLKSKPAFNIIDGVLEFNYLESELFVCASCGSVLFEEVLD